MIENFKKVLILAPHTDDGEFGCGGTISKIIETGTEVFYVAFSSCEESVPEGFPKNILVKEVQEATKHLGIAPDKLKVLNYRVRRFSYHRQEILEDLIQIRKKIDPDVVFIPSIEDVHQDHSTISNEAVRAFKNSSIFCYELPWNNFNFSMDCFVVLELKHIEKKIQAIKKYQSQSGIRPYASEDFLKSLASVRGVQIGVKYAEAFEIKRLVI
jgi:LmbE family N-acetylglucosaminyl deacetylase